MQYQNSPDLDTGIIREMEGQRRFLRVWPDPVFLQESVAGTWTDVEDVQDDFNITVLMQARDASVERYRAEYPEFIASIVYRQESLRVYDLPQELHFLFWLERRIEGRENMLRVVPPDVLRLVRQYPGNHFQVLQAFWRYPEIIEIAQSNPLLAFMAAIQSCWCRPLEGDSKSDTRSVLRQKRLRILEWLGFENPTKSTVRILANVPACACRPDLIDGLRETLDNPVLARRLGFLQRINVGALAVAAERSLLSLVSDAFLQSVAQDDGENTAPRTAKKLAAYQRLVAADILPSQPKVIGSQKQLQFLLATAAGHVQPPEIEEFGLAFPSPPFEDTPQIQAIFSPEEAIVEGIMQANCVGTLLPSLAAGKLFLYRVLSPERATLSIRRKSGIWSIDALETEESHRVSDETRTFVQKWLRKNVGATVR